MGRWIVGVVGMLMMPGCIFGLFSGEDPDGGTTGTPVPTAIPGTTAPNAFCEDGAVAVCTCLEYYSTVPCSADDFDAYLDACETGQPINLADFVACYADQIMPGPDGSPTIYCLDADAVCNPYTTTGY